MRKLEDLTKEELIKRVRLAGDLSVAMDGLWFVTVEKENGYEKALELDIDVWSGYAPVSLKRIRKHFDISGSGLEAIKEVVDIDPLWLGFNIDYPEDTENRLVFQVRNCPALEAQEKMGRQTFTCEPVEGAYLRKLAAAFDSRIKVKPLKLPPRESGEDVCCQWLLYFEDEE